MNKTIKKGKKGKLPNGWYVLPSKSYPHLVYYYNVLSNTSTWECPVTVPLSSDEDSEDKNLNDTRDRRVTSTNDFYPNTPARTVGNSSSSDDESPPVTNKDESPPVTNKDESPPVTNKDSTGSFTTFLLPSNSFQEDKSICHKKVSTEKEEKNFCMKDVPKSSQNNVVSIGNKVKSNGIVPNLINKQSKINVQLPSTTKSLPSDSKNDVKISTIKKRIWQKETARSGSDNGRVILKRGANQNKAISATKEQEKDELIAVSEKRMKPSVSVTVKATACSVQNRQEGITRKNLAENRMKALERSLVEKIKRPISSPTVLMQSTVGITRKNLAENRMKALERSLVEKIKRPISSPTVLMQSTVEACPNTQNDSYSDGKSCQSASLEKDYEEEMEWENIEDDIIMDVQELRDQIQQAGGISINDIEETKFQQPVNTQPSNPALFAVIDTNILLAYLNFLEEFRDTDIKGYGYPVLVIPWMVLQELDILKDRKGATKSPVTASRARRAIKFLHSNFHSHHPRVIGQTLPGVESQLLMKLCPDDSVLECCLQYKSVDKSVILISNDVNLCNKVEVHGINAYSKDELGNLIQKLEHGSSSGYQSSELGYANPISLENATELFSSNIDSSFVDTLFCSIKKILQDILGKILQAETEKIYGDKWIDVIHIKPPWTLPDILSCLVSHWIAIFGFIMPKHCFMLLKDLKTFFNHESREKGYDNSLNRIECIIDHSIRIIQEISDPQYKTLVTDGVQKLRKLQLTSKTKEKCKKHIVKTVVDQPEEPSVMMECNTENINEESFDNVHMSLKHSWSTVHTLCDNILIMMKSTEKAENFPSEKNIETLISYYYPVVEQFCYCCERIIKEDTGLLSIEHNAIQGIYSVLEKCNQTKSDFNVSLNDLLFFLRTDTARNMLVSAVTDFQKFAEIMRQGVDYFVSKDEANRQMNSTRKQ